MNSPVCNDQAIEADSRGRELNSRKAGTFRYALQLCESVSVAGRSSSQHHHAEGSRGGRRNAVRIGNEFSDCDAARWNQCGMHLAHESGACGWIEMVQEIGDQRQIVSAAKIDFESAAGEQVVAVGDAHRLGVLLGDFEHIFPVAGVDVRGGILFSDKDPEKYRDRQRYRGLCGLLRLCAVRQP
jgi:hypothetical protein